MSRLLLVRIVDGAAWVDVRALYGRRIGQRSGKEIEVLRAGFHRVDEEFVTAVESQNDQFQEAPLRVETEPELSRG